MILDNYCADTKLYQLINICRKAKDGFTDELELALEVMNKGKVMLNKLNVSDSSRNQLWRFARDGCLENVGMNNRAKPGERYVLDVLDNAGFVLVMLKRNSARDRFQKWFFTSVWFEFCCLKLTYYLFFLLCTCLWRWYTLDFGKVTFLMFTEDVYSLF